MLKNCGKLNMTYDLKRFHNNLPHLPPLQDVETKEIIKIVRYCQGKPCWFKTGW